MNRTSRPPLPKVIAETAAQSAHAAPTAIPR
jgi:hypothetical protein